MSTFTTYSRRIVTAAAGVGVLGASMATSAFAAAPKASDVPVPVVTRPVDASGGLFGVPRGSIPGVATPDLQQVPVAGLLPGLEVVPLPEPEGPSTATPSPDPADTATPPAPTPDTATPERASGGSALAGLDDAGFMSGLTEAVPAG